MTADNKLLDEFKELIEAVSLEIIKEAQMKEVAKDVVTRSYKAEIADALEVVSGEIERVKRELQGLDYISADQIKSLVYDVYEKQSAELKENEERIKNIINQGTQELYIANEKLRSDIATVNEQVEVQLNQTNQLVEKTANMVRDTKESLLEEYGVLKEQTRKLFFINYGLIATIIGVLIFVMIRGRYGA